MVALETKINRATIVSRKATPVSEAVRKQIQNVLVVLKAKDDDGGRISTFHVDSLYHYAPAFETSDNSYYNDVTKQQIEEFRRQFDKYRLSQYTCRWLDMIWY